MIKRKICVVTGTRAEYGLLHRLMRMIDDSESTQLQVIAMHMHLSPRYGETYKEIEADGFHIDVKIQTIDDVEPDNSCSKIKEMSRALYGCASAYQQLQPDLVLVIGDRYEMLAATEAAMISMIPIAHIGGGNVTEGAYDDAIRHSMTKMSNLHFVSTDIARNRVIQLGEDPTRVFNFGSIGIENILKMPLLSKEELECSLNFKVDKKTLLVTYHPVTLSESNMIEDITSLIEAIDELEDYKVIFTMPNSDTGGRVISDTILTYVQNNPEKACCFKSLGVKRYLSAMQYVGAVVGNSSSGVVETPSFHIPTLNIGNRQQGRVASESVYNCDVTKDAILRGLNHIFTSEFQAIVNQAKNPYEKPNIVKNIFDILATYPLDCLIQKRFRDL